MAIWLFRAGKFGEYENKFLSDGRVYLTWDDLNINLKKYSDKKELFHTLLEKYDDAKRNTVRNWLGQIYPIAHRVRKGDWVVLPSKLKSAIHIGEITGDYTHVPNAEDPFFHYREVNWFATDIPRSNFDQDILYSFGAFMTVCQIHRNNAEKRIKAMAENGWLTKQEQASPTQKTDELEGNSVSDSTSIDLEEFANDQIAKLIIRKFKGHRMEFLIESILNAKGYTTFRSPAGPDQGIDILAAPSPMGFGNPKLCVQVKSTESPIDRPTLDQLIGAINIFSADQGLLVSWGGFKQSVEHERAKQFFQVRLWGQKEIIQEFQANYDKLDEEIRTEIPLKRLWALSLTEDDN